MTDFPTPDQRYKRLAIDDIEALIRRNHKLYLAPDGSITVTPHSLAEIEQHNADLQQQVENQDRELRRLQKLLNTPETVDFLEGVKREAAHQRERWGAPHDREKSAEHWYWLVGYLARQGPTCRDYGRQGESPASHHQ